MELTNAIGARRAGDGVTIIGLIGGALEAIRAAASGEAALEALAPFARRAGFSSGALLCVATDGARIVAAFDRDDDPGQVNGDGDGKQSADLIELARHAQRADAPVRADGDAETDVFAAPCHADGAAVWILVLAASSAHVTPDEAGALTGLFATAMGGAIERIERAAAGAPGHAPMQLAMFRANAALRAPTETEALRREATQDALQRAQRLDALGHLAGGLAHDFNNLLAAVIGAFNIIERAAADARIKDIARQGVAAAQRGVHLVRQMRAFARRDALEVKPVDLAAHLRDAAPLVQRTLGSDTPLEVEIAPDLWPVLTDTDQLNLVLVNLAANAREAMQARGAAVLRAENVPAARAPGAIGPCVRVALRDEGGGMSATVLQRAVEPFFTTQEPGRASGLGLAMAHGFAQQTGGALVLENVGAGLEASLFLPRARVLAPEPAHAPPSGVDALPARVLLVDDDAEVSTVAAALLADLGVAVDVAGAAAEARALFAPGRYDTVLTDVVMPGGDGAALAADLRLRDPAVRVLFTTGHAGDEAQLAGEAVLRKPFSADDLAMFLKTRR